MLVIGFSVGDIGKEQALPDGLGLFDPGLLHRDHAFGDPSVFVDDGSGRNDKSVALKRGDDGLLAQPIRGQHLLIKSEIYPLFFDTRDAHISNSWNRREQRHRNVFEFFGKFRVVTIGGRNCKHNDGNRVKTSADNPRFGIRGESRLKAGKH